MSLKVKLISCISAVVLVIGLMIFGVFSVERASVNLGGTVSFEATNCLLQNYRANHRRGRKPSYSAGA